MRILVFEDNDVNQRIVGRMLKRLGHVCVLASDGASGLAMWSQARAQAQTFDLVLMDLELPDTTGYAATRLIRVSEGEDEPTPIIALTAHAVGEVRKPCLEAGMNDCLGKPLRLATLSEMLVRWQPAGAAS
jgi:CheY-like chemotaxis protein